MFGDNKNSLSKEDAATLRKSVSRPVILAGVVAGLFFGVGGAWSTLAPIASAALAVGTISPEGHRKTVQHLEGGIVREILVKDGDQVKNGDVLMTLEDTQALAAYRVQQAQLVSLKATEARLVAEEKGKAKPDWSTVPEMPGHNEAIQDQRHIFEARRESEKSERQILGLRVNQLEKEIEGFEAQIDSQTEQLALISDQIATMEGLIEQQLARKPQLLELKRQKAEILGNRASNQSAIARSEQTIGETQLQILNLGTRRRDEAANKLGETRTRIADLEERMAGTSDVLARTVVTAPADGTVFDLRMKTTGGVLRSGDPIMDIVPQNDELLVDARVQPNDIDVVTAGLEAQVTLTAVPQRNAPKLKGTVANVSADSMTDRMTGEVYYLARVKIDGKSLEELGNDIDLVPGMPANTMIFTGSRTFLEYLTEPLVQSINRSFREG